MTPHVFRSAWPPGSRTKCDECGVYLENHHVVSAVVTATLEAVLDPADDAALGRALSLEEAFDAIAQYRDRTP